MQNSPAGSTSLSAAPYPSSSTPSSFMDTFDFANSDFASSTTGLDDLFASGHPPPPAPSSTSSRTNAQSPASHHPSPSGHPLEKTQSSFFGTNSASHASSPLGLSRNRFDSNNTASPQTTADGKGHAELNFNAYRPQSSPQQHQFPPFADAPQLSIADMQQMLHERERSERIQNMQTALLKQQLAHLSRVQQQQQSQHQQQRSPQQQQQQMMGQQSNAQYSQFTGQVSPEQQQEFLVAFQNAFAAGNNPSAHNSVVQAAAQFQQDQPWQSQGQTSSADGSSVLAQYGLITPLGSGAFNNNACPPNQANFMSPLNMPPNSRPGSVGTEPRPGHDYLGSYTPLESPAVTPASVFSTGSTGIVMSELFSPLISPALGPQPTSMAEMMLPPGQLPQSNVHHHHASSSIHNSPAFNATASTSTPTASPLALIGKSSSGAKIRKNRSTTAEARANKVRPSPLIKPQTGARKKKDSISISTNGLVSPNPSLGSNGNGSVGATSKPGSRRTSLTNDAATSAPMSNSHSSQQGPEAGNSEGSNSTPSPIDLGGSGMMPPPTGPSNKALTPGSIMGIRPNASNAPSMDQQRQHSPTNRGGAGTPLASARKGRDDAPQPQQAHTVASQPPQMFSNTMSFPNAGSKVSFNIPSQMGVSNGAPSSMAFIQPGGLSQADRDSWMTYKSAGGLESRRTSHKAAEQKRRDSLKFCFDELRGLLPAIALDEDAPNGSLLSPDGALEDVRAERFSMSEVLDADEARAANKAISKVALLRHSNEYLIRLKGRLDRRDQALVACRREIADLRRQLGLEPSEDPSVTGAGPPLSWNDDEDFDEDAFKKFYDNAKADASAKQDTTSPAMDDIKEQRMDQSV